VAAGAGVVLEANFVRDGVFATRLSALPARFVQIHCSAPIDVLVERYANRERHPGHVDGERIDALRDAVESGRHDPLDLPGETILLDTSQEIDLEDVLVRVQASS